MRSAADGAPSFVHVPGLAGAPGEIAIGGEEAHYLRRVVRVRPGESVTASDGEGTLAELVILECAAEVRAEVRGRRTVARRATLELWCGAPEGDRADWLVEKLGELGVATLRPLDCERGRWERPARRAGRWDRLAVAALRQSRSAHRLRILPPVELRSALEAAALPGPAWLADPAGAPFEPRAGGPAGEAVAAVGPSGGFSEAELNRLREKGFLPTRIVGARLRTETAAVAMAVLFLGSES